MPLTLFLILEGPLQSWGERARWSVRDTAPEPTRSGVVGLLGCALGWRQDADLRRLAHALHMAVRCDRPGSLVIDYHTVVGGVLSAEGKIKRNAATKLPETVVTWRQYLCDACFVAALQSSQPELLEQAAQALQTPVWPMFLGRKSCLPSRPVFGGLEEHPNLEAALQAYPLQARAAARQRLVTECTPGQGVMRRDQVDSNSRRSFLPRYTREDWLHLTPPEDA